jgi:membrane protein involved in colicin uptake
MGCSFPCGDDAALAAALRRAAGDSVWREQAAARNRAIIATRADWQANMRSVEDLFERLVAQRAAQSGGGAAGLRRG